MTRITLLLAGAMTLSACAVKRESVTRYSPPSVTKAWQSVSSAQAKAERLESKAPAELKPEIAELRVELTAAQTALGSYAKEVAEQTDQLNEAIDEKNSAVADAQNAWSKQRKALKELWFWRGIAILAAGVLLAGIGLKTGWKFMV